MNIKLSFDDYTFKVYSMLYNNFAKKIEINVVGLPFDHGINRSTHTKR